MEQETRLYLYPIILCVCIYSMYDTACPLVFTLAFIKPRHLPLLWAPPAPPASLHCVSSLRCGVRIDLLGCGSLLICYLHSLLRIRHSVLTSSSSSFSLFILFTILYCIPHESYKVFTMWEHIFLCFVRRHNHHVVLLSFILSIVIFYVGTCPYFLAHT